MATQISNKYSGTIGTMTTVYIFLEVEKDNRESVMKTLRARPEVILIEQVEGPSGLIVVTRVPEPNELMECARQTVASVKDIVANARAYCQVKL